MWLTMGGLGTGEARDRMNTCVSRSNHVSLRVRRGTSLSSPKATRDYLALKLGTLEREVFAVIFLDKRHRLISYQEMFQGYSPFGRAVRASFPRPATASQAREPDSPPGFSSKAASNLLRRPVASLDT
jgi:hypothetical protein